MKIKGCKKNVNYCNGKLEIQKSDINTLNQYGRRNNVALQVFQNLLKTSS